jgi:hypothetical protein
MSEQPCSTGSRSAAGSPVRRLLFSMNRASTGGCHVILLWKVTCKALRPHRS